MFLLYVYEKLNDFESLCNQNYLFCHFPPIWGLFLMIISHPMTPTTFESWAVLDVVDHDLWFTTVFWIFRKKFFVCIKYFMTKKVIKLSSELKTKRHLLSNRVDYVEISGYPSWVRKAFSVFRGDLRKFTSLEKRFRLLSS